MVERRPYLVLAKQTSKSQFMATVGHVLMQQDAEGAVICPVRSLSAQDFQ